MPDSIPCPDARSLQQLLLGQVPDAQAEVMEQHLLSCAHCVETVRMFKDEATFLADIKHGSALSTEVPHEGPEIESLVRRMHSLTDSATFNPNATAATVALEPGSREAEDRDRTAAAEFSDCLLPAQQAGEIGRLGPYRVLKVLGAGGMGVVFQAEDPQLQRYLALKVMRGQMASDTASRERFLREARAAAKIEHDHIVAVYQVGEDQGIPYLAMPLLQGETLESRLERESVLPLADTLRIAREIAAGLAAAHARDLIHRDIKPGNIWLEAGSGRVKIVDFGLARLTQENVNLTRAGYILGTPSYMAPEQASGGASPVDGRCDLYSLGVVLYRMVTGRLPFVNNDLIALLAAVATEDPVPPRSLNPDVPPALNDVILRLLAKSPDERPASAEAVIELLRAIECGQPIAVRPARRGYRTWALAAVLVILLGAVVPLAGPAVYRIVTNQGELVVTSTDPDVRVRIKRGGEEVDLVDLKTNTKLLLRAGQYEIELAGSPEKLRLSTDRFTLTRNGRQIVSVERVPVAPPVAGVENKPNTTESKRAKVGEIRSFMGHKSLVSSVALSTDGKRAVSGSYDKTIRLWDMDSGQELKSFEGHTKTVRSVAISPDGKRLASGGGDQVVRLWDVSSGQQQRELRGHTDTITGVCFSTDGKLLVSAALDQTINLWSVASGKGMDRQVNRYGPVQSVAFSPNGRYVLFAGLGQFVNLWNLDTAKVEAWKVHDGEVNSVAFSRDGHWAASGGAEGTVVLWDVDEHKQTANLTGSDRVLSLAFTPDGKRILAGYADGVLRLWDVASRREAHRFTGHKGKVWSVAVSADGRLALSGGEDRTVRLWGLPPPD